MINPAMKLSTSLFTEVEQKATRDGFGDGLVIAGEKNRNVVVLCCDLVESTRAQAFARKFPERFIEVGVAEQNMMGIAAGLSFTGKIPFITSYAVFSPGRNWDQLRVSVCYSSANVKVIGAHAGISVGPDGATHQAMEDLAITRVLPRMTVIAPADYYEAKKAIVAAAERKGPLYMRFGREKVPVVTSEETPFEIGKAQVYKFGKDVAVIACGPLVYESLIAAKQLEGKISVMVINCPTIKPIDIKAITEAARATGAVVTAEEHQINGGLGSAVAEVLAEHSPVPMQRVGALDTFGESGKPEELMQKYHLSSADIVAAVRKVVLRKKGR